MQRNLLTLPKINEQKIQASRRNFKKKKRPRRDSNSQSSDSKSDALSIRPRGQWNSKLFVWIYKIIVISGLHYAFQCLDHKGY